MATKRQLEALAVELAGWAPNKRLSGATEVATGNVELACLYRELEHSGLTDDYSISRKGINEVEQRFDEILAMMSDKDRLAGKLETAIRDGIARRRDELDELEAETAEARVEAGKRRRRNEAAREAAIPGKLRQLLEARDLAPIDFTEPTERNLEIVLVDLWEAIVREDRAL